MNRSFSSRPRGTAARRARRWILVTTVVASTLGFSVAGAAIATQPPVVDDTQVNNSATDTGNNQTWQTEPTLAVRGSIICAGFNDTGPNPGFSGFARSANGGQSWTDLGELGAGHGGDPAIAVNQTSGTFYYAENATIGGNPAIGVSQSTDNCQTFVAQLNASAASSGLGAQPNRTVLSDKPSVAVDNTGGANNGNVYVCWTRFIDTTGGTGAETSELRFSRLVNGGAQFTNEQVIGAQGTGPFGCSVQVGPNGEVEVAWSEGEDLAAPLTTVGNIRHRVSTDGGQTFGALHPVAAAQRIPGSDLQVFCDNQNRRTLNGNVRMLPQAWLAADATAGPFSGNLYAVWARDPAGGNDNSDVLFSRSTDDGVTWSAPLQLGATTVTDQFEPNVAVGGRGVVSVVWYDRVNDAANLNIDVYKAFSTDGGATFGAAERVTNQSFGVPPLLNPNFSGVNNCHLGEYLGLAADANSFYYIWTDSRRTVTIPPFTSRPDPDIFFESESVPVGPPTTLTLTPKEDTNPVDAQHCVTATDKDVFGNPTPGITDRFSVVGSVNTSGSQTTDANGQATFCYTGPAFPGSDQISAFADTNNNTGQDPGEPGDTASKQWVLPASTPGCRVTDGGNITASNGDPATFGSFARVSASGTPAGEQQYQDHGPAVDLNVHSTAVLAVVCGGRNATVFGTATINGSSVIYRIDLTDNGKPGVGKDTYRIRLSTGYDSGVQTLTGGNIQLR